MLDAFKISRRKGARNRGWPKPGVQSDVARSDAPRRRARLLTDILKEVWPAP